MKKKNLLLVLLAGLLVSCATGNKESISSTVSSIESSNSQSSIEVKSDSSNSSEEIVTSSSERVYEDVDWNDETLTNIKAIIGDVVLPYYKTREHESSVATDPNSGYKYIDIICKGANVNNAVEYYKNLLIRSGYKVTLYETVNIGYMEVSATDNVYIQFFINTDYDFEIMAYQVTERTVEWPSKAFEIACGYDIPKMDAVSYDFSVGSASNGNYDIYGYCCGVGSDAVNTYSGKLTEAGYTIEEVSGVMVANNTEKAIQIWYYQYDESKLFIRAFCTVAATYFPSDEVNLILGEDLPVLSFEGVVYSRNVVTTEDGYEVYTIYCDNASEDDLTAYRTLLLEANWEVTDSNETDSYVSYVFTKENDSGEHQVQIIYSIAQECIAIAIYY